MNPLKNLCRVSSIACVPLLISAVRPSVAMWRRQNLNFVHILPENRRVLKAFRSTPGLWAEFTLLYLGVPMVLAFALPPGAMFTVLGVMTVVGLVLLHRTPGFAWHDLTAGNVPWK